MPLGPIPSGLVGLKPRVQRASREDFHSVPSKSARLRQQQVSDIRASRCQLIMSKHLDTNAMHNFDASRHLNYQDTLLSARGRTLSGIEDIRDYQLIPASPSVLTLSCCFYTCSLWLTMSKPKQTCEKKLHQNPDLP